MYDSVRYLPAVLLLEVKYAGRNYTGFFDADEEKLPCCS